MNEPLNMLAETGADAAFRASSYSPNTVFPKFGLPNMSSGEVIRKSRAGSSMPIIVAGARGGNTDKTCALGAGTDNHH